MAAEGGAGRRRARRRGRTTPPRGHELHGDLAPAGLLQVVADYKRLRATLWQAARITAQRQAGKILAWPWRVASGAVAQAGLRSGVRAWLSWSIWAATVPPELRRGAGWLVQVASGPNSR
jgi:hypothetical protein